MKLPKFMKSHKSESQKSSGRQLLITELNFQPHKNAAAIMNFDKSLYMTPRGLNKAMMMTPKLGTDNKPVVVANNYGGRYVKSAQPKRLQNKPKAHAGSVAVQAKPINTPITQMLASTRTSLVFDTTPVLKKLENQQSQSALTGRKLESSSAVDTVDSKPAPMKSVESSSPANKENVAATPSKLDTALVETPHATNRFSFSKLTRFVSKSALKVMSRKLSSSPMSLDSSTASSSSASISPPSTPTRTVIESDLKRDGEKGQEVVDKDDVKRDEDINKPVLPLLPSIPSQSAQQQAVYCELDSASSNCGQVYKSDEQRAEIEKRVTRMIEEQRACPATSIRSNWCSSSSRLAPIRNRVPNMGITSVMLRELKRKQQETNGVNSSGTIGIIPFACLISAPHIFPSTASIAQQPPVVEHQKVTPHQEEEKEDENDSTLQQSPPQYDRLSRVPFLGDEVTSHSATKKTAMLSRPMVKSLSSIAPLVMPPPPTPSTPTQTATQTPSSCRISIFSARKLQLNSMCQSTGHLVASQQPFESFSETVF